MNIRTSRIPVYRYTYNDAVCTWGVYLLRGIYGTPVAGARAHRGGETTAEVIVVVAADVGPVAGKSYIEQKNANIEIRGLYSTIL